MGNKLTDVQSLGDRMNESDAPQSEAARILASGIGHMEDRARTYDSPSGERSVGKTVAMFNILTGHSLTEEEGWHFMCILKQVRSQQGDYKADNYEDQAAFAGLAGESALKDRG